MQAQFQLCSYIHARTNETHSLANLQDLIPTLAGIIISSVNQSKQGLNLIDLLQNVLQLCMHRCNYSARIVFA